MISGGERQLVLLARALAQEPQFIVLDEPTASLDFGNQGKVMREIRALAGAGHGVLFTTHDPNHALRAADRAYLLRAGERIAEGAVGAVLTREQLEGALRRAGGDADRYGNGPRRRSCRAKRPASHGRATARLRRAPAFAGDRRPLILPMHMTALQRRLSHPARPARSAADRARHRRRPDRRRRSRPAVTVERALTIFLNSQEIVTAMTIGDYPEYLALGYLLNQNMLLPDDVVTGVDYDEELVGRRGAHQAQDQLREEAEEEGADLRLRAGHRVRRPDGGAGERHAAAGASCAPPGSMR